jgi:hypothetical protein
VIKRPDPGPLLPPLIFESMPQACQGLLADPFYLNIPFLFGVKLVSRVFVGFTKKVLPNSLEWVLTRATQKQTDPSHFITRKVSSTQCSKSHEKKLLHSICILYSANFNRPSANNT